MQKGITLIGMPGSGKSTIGKIVAQKLGWKFVDLDTLIKEKTKRSHGEILYEDGADELVRLEGLYTNGLDLKNTVFSPGGSIIYSPQAMKKLRGETLIVYLELPLAEIKKRLAASVKCRGMVGVGIVGLKEKGIEALFAERTPAYASLAHQVVRCSGLSQTEIANTIIRTT